MIKLRSTVPAFVYFEAAIDRVATFSVAPQIGAFYLFSSDLPPGIGMRDVSPLRLRRIKDHFLLG